MFTNIAHSFTFVWVIIYNLSVTIQIFISVIKCLLMNFPYLAIKLETLLYVITQTLCYEQEVTQGQFLSSGLNLEFSFS